MIVYRLSQEKYAHTLSASGAANRWNTAQQYVLYTASSRSLATVEQLVHMSGVVPKAVYKMMIIEITTEVSDITTITQDQLGDNWRSFQAVHEHRIKGAQWYADRQSLLLQVPSIVLPQEHNYVINTTHSDFKSKVKLQDVEPYFWDDRFFH